MITEQREALWQSLHQLAPLKLAGGWDNVGVLWDPPQPEGEARAPGEERILLTIDLTESVMREAIEHDCSVIVAYHPVIFGGLKRITPQTAQGRVLLTAAQRGIGIYSPHTALDAVPGGVCDWLAAVALTPLDTPLPPLHDAHNWPTPLATYQAIEPCDVDQSVPSGAGRRAQLQTPVPLSVILKRLHVRLNQDANPDECKEVYLRAVTPDSADPESLTISDIALCPGAGGGLFEGVSGVDLLITGEMRHHDLLHRAQSGTAVILTEHSRCERGFLTEYARLIRGSIGAEVLISRVDDDPLWLYKPE